MLAFTGKYCTGCLYLNNCVHGLESFLYLKLNNAIILVNASMGNKYSTFRVRYCPCWHLLVDKGSPKSIIHAVVESYFDKCHPFNLRVVEYEEYYPYRHLLVN